MTSGRAVDNHKRTRRGAWLAAAALLLAAVGCGPYGNAPAPQMRLLNVAAITDSLQRGVTLPGDGVAVIEIVNPGPAMRVEEFRFVLALGEAELGHGHFRGDVLVNEGSSRVFNVPLVNRYIPAVRMAVNRARPLRIDRYQVIFVDGNNARRVEQWPVPAPGAR